MVGADSNGRPFANQIGRQGLFFDRFDLLSGNYLVPLDPNAAGGPYYNRNNS